MTRRVVYLILAITLTGMVHPQSTAARAFTTMPADAVIEIYTDEVDPADVEIDLGERVAWHNLSSLPRRVLEEDVDLFDSNVLMPNTGRFEYAAQFAGTFHYRVDTAPVAFPADTMTLRGSVGIRPIRTKIGRTESGLVARFRWGTRLPDGWTFDVQRIPPTGPLPSNGWETWYRATDLVEDGYSFVCNGRSVMIRTRLRNPTGAVSDWSPPSGGVACIAN